MLSNHLPAAAIRAHIAIVGHCVTLRNIMKHPRIAPFLEPKVTDKHGIGFLLGVSIALKYKLLDTDLTPSSFTEQ